MQMPGFIKQLQQWVSGAKSNVTTVKEAGKQASFQQANPIPFKRQPIAEPSEGMRKLFNDSNWKAPDVQKSVAMPAKSFDLSGSQALKSHTYSLEAPEWKRAQEYYSSENAQAWGWQAPAEDKVRKDLEQREGQLLETYKSGAGMGPGLNPEDILDEAKRTRTKIEKLDRPKVTEENYTAAPLTWEAYNALPSEKRTAIDWNTLLVEAREKDLAGAPTLLMKPMDESAKAEYEAKVQKIFGEAGGSQRQAPATVSLLDNLGITAKGQDLDEYLALDRAVTSEEMMDFEFSAGQLKTIDDLLNGGALNEEQTVKFGEVKSPENLRVAEAKNVEAMGAKIKEALSHPENNLWNLEAMAPGLMGEQKTWKSEEVPLGFGTPELRGGGTDNVTNFMEGWLNEAYAHLKSPKGDPKDIWASMTEKKFTKEETQAFFDYMDTKLSQEEQYGAPTVAGSTEATRSAKEIRKILGMKD